MTEEYRTLDDKDLLERLERAGLAERLTTSMEWGLLKEAGRRIVDRATDQFAMKTEVTDMAELSDLKAIIRKWKYGIFNEIEMLRQDGESAFEEAQNKKILDDTGA